MHDWQSVEAVFGAHSIERDGEFRGIEVGEWRVGKAAVVGE